MDPITGVVEKKVADSVFDIVRKWWTRDRDQKKQIEVLKALLDEKSAEKAAFERKLSELVWRPEDDNIYWTRDGRGAFCPLCINGPEKLFTPLTHGATDGSYCCGLHDRHFETEELRERRRSNRVSRPIKQYRGPHAWMGR